MAAVPPIARDPATHDLMIPMRDGVRLRTSIWLPAELGNGVPAILLRSPYGEQIVTPPRLQSILRYRESGFAVVFQIIRGIPPSEGVFSFNDPLDRTDGFDTIEWIAAQTWSDGGVGMDGSSYLALTQLSAAIAQPPHLKCIIPAVPSADWFREPPYIGGCFSRQHTLNWTKIISVSEPDELADASLTLADPAKLQRMASRPVVDAAEGLLTGDKLAHYRDVLAHPTQDEWWRTRTLGGEDYARISVPLLLVSGNFDFGIGALTVWKGLERHGPAGAERHLLIGPWDHGGCYAGGVDEYGPYKALDDGVFDMQRIRIAFFRKHLMGDADGPDILRDRVNVFVTGANVWKSFDAYPPRHAHVQVSYLHSSGHANSARGDGALRSAPMSGSNGADSFTSDPRWPLVTALSASGPGLMFDLRERAHHGETLVYASEALSAPLTMIGEPEIVLHLTADTPDADIIAWLAEERLDGRLVQLAWGALRLRYHKGFDREVLLEPESPIEARVRLGYIAHQAPAGARLKLLIGGDLFPLLDPNPNTGEPIATAVKEQRANVTVLHGSAYPSRLELPTLEE